VSFSVSQAAKKLVGEGKNVQKKEVKAKPAFPLPFNGEHSDSCCQALRQNNGLYTQCQSTRKGDATYCKCCQQLADKSGEGIPEYGTISMRLAVAPYDYVDPKGRKPTAYTKVMTKYNLSQEQVIAEAEKFGINVDPSHFVVPEVTKRGRPASKPKAAKDPNAAKGRPKKTNKVLLLAEDDEDLFASLVASANAVDEEDDAEIALKKEADKEAKALEKAEKEAKLAAEKLAKAEKLAQEKAEKEAKLAQEKAEKEAKLAAAKAEKEAKLAAEKAEKEAKAAKLAAEKQEKVEKLAQEKAEKEAKLAAAKAEKEAKLAEKKTKKAPEPEEEEEQETYKKCTGQDGKKYIRSLNSDIVYDLEIYISKEELVPIGKWVAETKTITFNKAACDSDSELEEEEEEEEEDE
jgi:hypothetical protein